MLRYPLKPAITRLCTEQLLRNNRNMSLRPFDDFFFRPAPRLHLFPTHPHQWTHSPHWPTLRISEEEDAFENFITSVDDRFSGMFANVHNPPRDVGVRHEDGASGDLEKPKKFEMRVAVQDFKPDDIKVKVRGDNLIVEAKREEKKEEEGMYAHSYREFRRTFTIPEGVDKKQLSSALSSGGILEIQAPIVSAIEQKPEEKKEVEVTHMED